MKFSTVRAYELLMLALAAACYTGYLSAVKFFNQTCVLTAPCPLFLGYPACYYGFSMFVVLTLLAALLVSGKPMLRWIQIVSGIGALFALYFVWGEWSTVMALFSHFSWLAIPSCLVGLVVYATIFALSSFTSR